VAAVGAFALAGPRGFAGLQSGSALLGAWLIIAGPILNHKHAIADSMYWSNSWAGGVLIALAATSLAAVALRWPGRRTASRREIRTGGNLAVQEHVMSLSHHHQHQLYRIETGLFRADPQLAAMLGIFGKLSAGQAMPSWEQVPTRRDRIRQAAALTVEAVTLAAAAIGLLLSAILALLIVVAGTRHGHRLPAPGPERTRRGGGADGRPDPAGQS
jgi:Protein of unknown function (DUF3040)